jgi:phosphate starvation-inducible protein PhoH
MLETKEGSIMYILNVHFKHQECVSRAQGQCIEWLACVKLKHDFTFSNQKVTPQRKDIQGQDRTQEIRKKRLYQKTYMYFINK